MKHSVVNHSHHVIHFIPRTDLSNHWKFVPFDHSNCDQTSRRENTPKVPLVSPWIFLGLRPGIDLHDRIHTSMFQAPASAELTFSVGFDRVGGWQVSPSHKREGKKRQPFPWPCHSLKYPCVTGHGDHLQCCSNTNSVSGDDCDRTPLTQGRGEGTVSEAWTSPSGALPTASRRSVEGSLLSAVTLPCSGPSQQSSFECFW